MYVKQDVDTPWVINVFSFVCNYIIFIVHYSFLFISRDRSRNLCWDLFFLNMDLFEIKLNIQKIKKKWDTISLQIEIDEVKYQKGKEYLRNKIIEKVNEKNRKNCSYDEAFKWLARQDKDNALILADEFSQLQSKYVKSKTYEQYYSNLILLRSNYDDLIGRNEIALDTCRMTGIMKKIDEEDVFRERVNGFFNEQYEYMASIKENRLFIGDNGLVTENDPTGLSFHSHEVSSEINDRFLMDIFPELLQVSDTNIIHKTTIKTENNKKPLWNV